MAAAAPSELMLVWWDWELGRGVLCVEMGGAASEVMGGDWVISDHMGGSRRSRKGGSISPSSSSFPSFPSSSSSSLLLPPLHLGLEIVGGASGGLQRIYGGRGAPAPPAPT